MAYKMPTWKIIKGFILTPIILSVFFSIIFSVFGLALGSNEPSMFKVLYVSLMGWFIHALPVATIIILVVGIPGYLFLKYLGFISLKQYCASGLTIGIALPLLLLVLHQPISWWLYLASGFFGVLASYVFWQISIRP